MTLTAKDLASQHKRGCMPLDQVQRLYDLRNAEVAALAGQSSISIDDVQNLERGGRFLIASEHFSKCTPQARNALLGDSSPGVRSAAAISNAQR